MDIRGSIFKKAGVIIAPDINIGANGVLEPVSVIEKDTLPGTVINDQKHKRISQILKTKK